MNKPENILIDTGFWIALYNERDRYHNDAIEIIELIADSNLILPWPTLYETINTRFSKNADGISNFEELIKEVAVTSIPDDIRLEFGELPLLNCDRSKMVQVIQNLLHNAYEHGKATSINISSKQDKDGVSVMIENDGMPIAEEIRERIFEESVSIKQDGGLGLIIVKRIVEAHGWEISLEQGLPTTFKIYIPIKAIQLS